MSAQLIHVTVARINYRERFFNALYPLTCMCSRFFRCRVTLVYVSMWYIIHLLITHYSPQQKENSDPFACDSETSMAMCSRAQIPGEQHFSKVYLGCHMQGQGLLTDMISVAGGKGTHYPQTVWSHLHSFQTTLFVWCFKRLMMIVSEMHLPLQKKNDEMRAVEANRRRQAGRTVAAESDDITPTGRLWEKMC